MRDKLMIAVFHYDDETGKCGAEPYRYEKEIVLCKECINNTIKTDETNECWCYKFGYVVEDTDFCSYGERIDNE